MQNYMTIFLYLMRYLWQLPFLGTSSRGRGGRPRLKTWGVRVGGQPGSITTALLAYCNFTLAISCNHKVD